MVETLCSSERRFRLLCVFIVEFAALEEDDRGRNPNARGFPTCVFNFGFPVWGKCAK